MGKSLQSRSNSSPVLNTPKRVDQIFHRIVFTACMVVAFFACLAVSAVGLPIVGGLASAGMLLSGVGAAAGGISTYRKFPPAARKQLGR